MSSEESVEGVGDRLEDQIIMTAAAFAPAVVTRRLSDARKGDDNAMVMRLRDSLRYRSDAIEWHISLISFRRKAAENYLQAVSHHDPNAPGDVLRQSSREQQFVFDDVVFNAIALFDYVGNTIAFSLYGEPFHKAKWKRVEEFARKPTLERKATKAVRISGTAIGATVLEIHRGLYLRLLEYRSELLHYETVPAGGRVSTEFKRDDAGSFKKTTDLRITAPEAFSKWCSIPGYQGRQKEIPIDVAATWVGQQTQVAAISLLKELERELRREAGRDPDGTDRIIQIL